MTELIRFTFRGRAIILQNNWKKATSPREYRQRNLFKSLFKWSDVYHTLPLLCFHYDCKETIY